jgi:hypothetical protein
MNDGLIFLLLAGIALVFKWLTRQGSDEKENRTTSSPNEHKSPSSTESEQERVRRFLEALGAPPGSQPPPPVRPRPGIPRRVILPNPAAAPPKARRTKWAQPLPPLTTTPPLPPPVVTELLTPAPVAVAPPPLAPIQALPLPVPLARTAPVARPLPLPALGLMLRKRGSVRQAIILREILGPPRALQPLSDARGL